MDSAFKTAMTSEPSLKIAKGLGAGMVGAGAVNLGIGAAMGYGLYKAFGGGKKNPTKMTKKAIGK